MIPNRNRNGSGLALPPSAGPVMIPVDVQEVPGDSASPLVAVISTPQGVTVVSKGGLTKRQTLAAQFLAASLSHVSGMLAREQVQDLIVQSLGLADALLQVTEASPSQPTVESA